VTLEACPTSNWHTGVIRKIEEHPLAEWLGRGISVCLCTDNTLLSGVDAPEEHGRAAGIRGMTPEKLKRVIACGAAARFVRA
jgi:adenosine deaminase